MQKRTSVSCTVRMFVKAFKGIGLHVVLCYGQESFSHSHIFNGRSVVYLVEDIFGRERAGLFFDAGKASATSPYQSAS